MLNPALPRDTIFLTVTGSHAYGLATPASDLDRRGVRLLRAPAHYLGLDRGQPAQQHNWASGEGEDTVVYEFRKAMRLFADGNPNMVEMLFTPPHQHQRAAAAFLPVLAARQQLVTQRLGKNFAAFGRRQFDDLKRQRLKLSDPTTRDAHLAGLGESRRGAFDRRLGYDTKRAAHALRTLSMAQEVLRDGEVRVERPDARRLMAVRGGDWSFARLEAEVEAAQDHAAALAEASTLPAETDAAAWEALTVATIEEQIWTGRRPAGAPA